MHLWTTKTAWILISWIWWIHWSELEVQTIASFCSLTSISWFLCNLKDFPLSHWVWDNEVWLQPMHEIFAGLQSSKTSIFPRLTYPCSFLSHQVGKGELSLHGIPLCFHLCVRLLQISKGFLTLLSTKAQWILYSLFSPIQMKRKLQNLTHVNSPFDQEYC